MIKLRMSDDDINKIANRVVEVIMLRQKEIDDAYYSDPRFQTELSEGMLLQNLVGLQILLSEYVKQEKYEEAELTKQKIEEIKTLLDRLK